jgi:hypothetical protein
MRVKQADDPSKAVAEPEATRKAAKPRFELEQLSSSDEAGDERESGSHRRTAWLRRLVYASLMMAAGAALSLVLSPRIADYLTGKPERTQPAAPARSRLVPQQPSAKPAAPVPAPQPSSPAPAARTKTPVPERPVVKVDERSLTATGKSGKAVAEIHGDLPKIKQQMQRSVMGTKPIPDAEAPPADCVFKQVMSDEDIAACRAQALRR